MRSIFSYTQLLTISLPFYRVAGRILLSKKRLNEWRMLKESLPDFNWEEEVVEKQHKLRLIEIHKRTLELCKICEPVYERLEKGEYHDEVERKEMREVADTAFKEMMELDKEESEIKDRQKADFRKMLGIEPQSESK